MAPHQVDPEGERAAAPGASFPQRYARTQRFTLGQPRGITVAPDGSRVVFLRSEGGEDAQTKLWMLDVASGGERMVDPSAIGRVSAQQPAESADDLPPEERARRERRRESAGGIIAYATDRAVTVASFALGGRAYACDLLQAVVTPLPVGTGVVDPRVDPTGSRVAFVRGGDLRVVETGAPTQPDAPVDTLLLAGDNPDVTFGLAEFIAAEEMGRHRGYWWSPDGQRLAVARVDNAPVARWHIADPAHPERPPVVVRYPAPGAANADVRLLVTDLEGNVVEIRWDRDAFPYLVEVVWSQDGPLTLVVQSRDQRSVRILAADPELGTTVIERDDHDRFWLQLVPGTPRWLPGGRLLHTLERDGFRRVAIDGQPLLPATVHVRRVAHVSAEAVLLIGSTDPTTTAVWRVPLDTAGPAAQLTPASGGLHDAAAGGGTLVLQSRTLERHGVRTGVSAGDREIEIASYAAAPGIAVNAQLVTLGQRQLRCALVLPHEHASSQGRLPVLLDPYGGPGAQRVLAARDAYLQSQWFADQGFAVLIVDGRGTPGRGLDWEHAVAGDLAAPVLEDQVDALVEAARRYPLDLDRVAIRGWSFGGYLAALAVLRRPDLFHAAIAGAPVTDWRLYDTHYTERYLGQPNRTEADGRHGGPEAYDRTSLLSEAHLLRRPLLLIHGLADDNVVAAHTLQFSNALLEAGRPHQVLPLTSVTHMASQATVAENLLHLQLAFLADALR